MFKSKWALLLIAIIAVIFFVFIQVDQKQKQEKLSRTQVAQNIQGDRNQASYDFIMTDQLTVEPFNNQVLIFDGNAMILIGENGKEVFHTNYPVNHYSLDFSEDQIFLLNKESKELTRFDIKGNVLHQVKNDFSPQSVTALSSNQYIIHYTTDIGVEGIKLFDTNNQMLQDMSFPDLLVTGILKHSNGNFSVIGLNKNAQQLETVITNYNAKGEAQTTGTLPNALITDSFSDNRSNYFLDPNTVYLTDKNLKLRSRAGIFQSTQKMIFHPALKEFSVLTHSNEIYRFALDGTFKNEKKLNESITDFVYWDDRIVYASEQNLVDGAKIYQYDQPVIKLIKLENSVAVVQRGRILFEKELDI